MSNIRLYYPGTIVKNSTNLLSKEHTHYLTNVMRLKRGSNVNLFNKELKRRLVEKSLFMIDIYEATKNEDGFSNSNISF